MNNVTGAAACQCHVEVKTDLAKRKLQEAHGMQAPRVSRIPNYAVTHKPILYSRHRAMLQVAVLHDCSHMCSCMRRIA